MVSTKTIVIGGIIGAVAVTAIVVGVVLGTRSSGCSPEPPSNVTVEFNDENTIIAWVQPEENEDCEATYLVSYSIGDESVRNATVNLEELTATITQGIEACTDLHVQIWAVDEDGDLSEESYENTFTAAPKEFATLEVDFNVVATGLQVVWTTPEEQEHCGISYKIAVDTDLNEPTDAVEVTGSTHTIGGDSYCVGLTVDIIPVMGDTELEPQKHIYRSPEVGNLDVKYEENTLIASWDPYSKQANCEVKYRVIYYNGETVSGTDNVTEPALSVALPACSVDKIEVVTFIDDFESKAATEVANTYPTSVPSVTNLEIAGNVLSWTPIQKIGDCIATYVINIQGDIQDQGYTETETYTVENACFQFVATVGTVIGNVMSSTPPYVLYNNDEPVNNIQIVYPTESPNQFIATWEHSKHELCSLVYDVNYIVAGKTIPQVRVDQGRTSVDLDPLYCVDGGEISIVARAGDIGSSRAATKAVVSTTPIEVPDVSGVELEETEDGLVLSWSEIEVGQCDVEYIIKIGEIDLPPATTPFTIPEAEYCLTFDATVRAKINTAESDPSETKTYENRDPVTDITITPDPPGNFIATWKHPKDESCDLDYEYTYTVEGKDTETDTVQVPTVTLESPEGCITGQIEIIAVEGEFKTEPATKPVPGDYPSTLPAVTGVELNENTLDITWNPVTANGECPVKYEVTIVSDSKPEPQVYPVDGPSYTVDKDAFCFTFTATIRAVMGDDAVQGEPTTYKHTKIPPVTNVEVDYPSATPGQFSITWQQDKRATCVSKYRVIYTLDPDEEYATKSVDDTEATMDLVYCASGTVKVVPFVDEDNGDGETKPVEKKYPDQVAQITKPVPIADGISWEAVPEIGKCSIEYTVDFVETDGVPTPTPGSTTNTNFPISVNDYCFTYTASVTTVVKDPSDDSIVKKSDGYDLDEFKYVPQVTNIKVTPTGTPNKFTASWDPPKTGCSTTYEVTYSADGSGTPDPIEPPYELDLVYCAEGTIEVVAVSDELKSAPQKQSVLEYPAQLGAVTITNINPPSITWNPIDPIDQCNIQYAISIVRDRETGNIDDTISGTSYAIEETDYCFTYTATVKGVIRNADNTEFESEGTPDSKTYEFVQPVEGITIQYNEATNQFSASWNHPKASCSPSYEVTYTVDGTPGTPTPTPVSDPSIEYDLVYCASGKIEVVALGDGARSTPVEKTVQRNPSQLDKITGLTATRNLISWDQIQIDKCEIKYAISITSEGPVNPPTSTPVLLPPYTIDDDQYCLTYEVTVNALIEVAGENDVVGEPENSKYDGEEPTIDEIEPLNPSLDETFTVNWSHDKHELCSLEYKVSYNDGSTTHDGDPESNTTQDFTRTTCDAGVITVTAFIPDTSSESPPATKTIDNCPASILK